MIYKIQLDEIVNTSASFRERILSFIYIKQNHCTNLIYYSIKLLATKLLYPYICIELITSSHIN